MASRPPSDATLSDYVSSGETVVVRVIDAPGAAAPTPVAAAPTPTPPPAFDEEQDEDMKLAMALSLGAAPPQPVAAPAMAAPAMAAGTDGERLVRRVIPADNSCLFAAVAHAMEGSAGRRVRADGLRRIVAEAVKADGGLMYGEAVLGQPVEAYMKWIMQDSSWGGGIELAILADHYGVELTALDVQSLRVDAFGSGKGYANRALVLYDGIHYDLIVRQLFDGAPEELDVSVFLSDDESVLSEARALAAEAQSARKFTDTSAFTLRCLVCQCGLVGENGALEHAKKTGHTNFAEFK